MAEKNSLWKNIRNKAKQNRASGATPKKPTDEMLRQERKIKTKHPDGGPVNTLEGDLISKVIMNRNRDKDFVKRAYAVGEYPESNMFVQPDANEFGEKNSHLMSWGEDESGQTYMYPEVMNPNNEAVKVPNQYADYISSTGYKKVTGIPHAEGGYYPTQGPGKALFKGYAKGGPVGEDETSILEKPLSMPMEGYEWEDRPEKHVEEPVKKSTVNKSKSKDKTILNLRLGNSLYTPYNTSDYSEPKYESERDISSTKATPAMSTKPEPKDITSGKITLQDLDVITDVMQLGNFVPHPLGQAIGQLGNWGGAAIDGLQAYDAYDQGNYSDMAINIGSAGLGVIGGAIGPKFTRDMYNTTPGSLADKIASLGSRNGTYIPLTARPNLRNNAVINKALNYNRAGLGLAGVETIYDSKATGGPIINNNKPMKKNTQSWKEYLKYAQGGRTNPYNQYHDDEYLQYEVGGKVWQDIGAGAWGVLKGTAGVVTGGMTDSIMDKGYDALQKAANKDFDPNDPEDLKAIKEINTVKGAGQIGGAVLGGVVSGNVKGAVDQGISGTTEIVNASDASDSAKQWTNTIGGLAKTGLSMGSGKGTGFKGVEGMEIPGIGSMESTEDATSKMIGNIQADSIGKMVNSVGAKTGAGTEASGFGDMLSNFSGSKFGQNANKAMPFAEQAVGAVGDNKGSLMEQGEAQQDFINSPEQLALKKQKNQDYTNQGLMYSQGGNMSNNSLNLRNTMRYKRFAQGGTFDQYGINMIPESAGLHHQSAYGGVPIGPNALAEGGEVKMDIGNGNQYIVSDQVDGAETQKDFMFSKGGKYKELNRTLADGMKQDLNKYTFGSLATSDKVKGDLRRPNDSYAQNTIDQIKQKWQEKTEYARQRTQQEQAIMQAEEQKRMAEEQYIAAYGGKINPKKYPGLNMTKKAKGGYVHNQMTQPMLATGGPIYGDPASEYTYAMGGMYGDPYARGGQIDYTNDMYSSYAGGGPMVSNVNQPFKGPAAQNRGGMYIYADGGMMPQEQQMMQDQQPQEQQVPQEQMQQQPSQEQMMQMVQQAAQMLEQGAQPEQVMQQLVQAGVPQDMAMQAVQMAMQEMQGQMQQEQPMQGQEQMMPQGMANGGIMYYGGGNTGGPGTKKPVKKYYTDRAAYDKHYAGYRDTVDTRTNIAAIEAALAAQKFASKADFSQKMHNKYDTAVASGKINKNLLKNSPDKTKLVHTDKSVTNYQKGTSPTEKTIPVYTPPPLPPPPPRVIHEIEELKPLSITSIPIEETPLELNLSNTTYKAPPQPNRVIVREAGNIKRYNDDKHYKNSPEVYIDDTLSTRKLSNEELDALLKKYPGADSDEGWVRPAKERIPQAAGGMMPPQDGMASQVAQQLQQGAQPQQVLQKLIEQGMPQEQATAMVQAVMGQLQNQMQQQQPQQMAPQQPMMAARGGYFNGRKQYSGIDTSEPPVFSPLADESTMSKIAGLSQAVVPALASAFAFNKLSKRKIKPTTMEAALQNRDAEISALRDEWRSQTAAGLRQQRNMGQTAGSVAGNTRELILSSLKEGQKPIMQIYGEMSAANQQAQQQANLANKQATDDFTKENESMYQNAMQTGFEAAGQGVKNASSYYADLENRKLQRWQAMNTTGENWTWTPKGKAFRNKDGIYMINGIEVDPSTGNEI